MVAEVDAAHQDGDTLGGVVEVVADGLPPGLGSHVHWDRRLDSRLAAALMGIQAIKGVEVGDGFRTAARRGSQAHDEMDPRRRRGHPPPHRPRRRHRGRDVRRGRAAGAGGDEADLAPCRARSRPSTSPSEEPAHAIHQRSDVCAVPAAGVVAEAMVALVLAEACLEKFGGDTVAETPRNHRAYLAAVPSRCGRGRTDAARRPRRAARIRQDHHRRGLAERLGVALHDTDAAVEAARGPPHRRHLRRRRRGRLPRRSSGPRRRAALAEEPGVVALGGGAPVDPLTRAAARRAHGRLPRRRHRRRRASGSASTGPGPCSRSTRARRGCG